MLESNYKRIERIIVVIMILGIIAMFQPWFKNIVELFQPLVPDVRLGRTYTNEIAPIILRYGFYATFLSTVAFNVISHYSVEELQKAFKEKGRPLTFLLIALPVVYFFIILGHLAWAHYYAALLGVVNFVCAIAAWNWKRWGLIGLGLTALVELGLALSGSAAMITTVIILVAVIALGLLAWPRRTVFK
jgi:hypothetical protein